MFGLVVIVALVATVVLETVLGNRPARRADRAAAVLTSDPLLGEHEYDVAHADAALVTAGADASGPNDAAERNDLVRRVRLGVLEHRRRAVTELRDQNHIDDIVLRGLQSAMDLEEMRLLDAAGD